ncbi:MAG: HEPN domain-containing protein [Candidatus Aenigmarchaeota archaeon]|nr:HEPN domain-containing protein [Candidatus Aenigmarchaeota archaeon]
MTRELDKEEAKNYLKKAEEFLEESRDAMIKSRFNAAGFNAIQSVINANDALTIYVAGIRASNNHREAIKTHIEALRSINDSYGKRILINALEKRSEVGYSGKDASKALAEKLLKDAMNFIEWVKKYVI